MPKLFTFIFLFTCYVSSSQIRIYSNEFLSVGVSARATAMSGSVLASVNDASAGYWNPAALVMQTNTYEVSAMHAEYFAGIAKFDFVGGSYKMNDSAAIGVSIIRYGVDNIPNTLELVDENGNIDYERINRFSAADYAFLLSMSRKSKIKGLNYGLNAKIIYRNIGSFANAYGFGFDAAIQYSLRNWMFAANIKDITTTFNAWFYNTVDLEDVFIETGNEIPENSIELTAPTLLIGAARNFKINQNFKLLAELGGDFNFDGQRYSIISSKYFNADPHLGLELDYKKFVFVRAGIGNLAMIPDFDKKTLNLQPSIGIGLNIFNLGIDYALTDIGDQSIALYSNVFSLSYAFNNIKRSK